MNDLNFSQWIETDLQSEIFGFDLGIKLGEAQMLLYKQCRGEALTSKELQQLQRFDLKHAEDPKWLQMKEKVINAAKNNTRPTYRSVGTPAVGAGNDMRWIG